ncbi:MAG TPA: TonB C-terminal domain-containing protein [Gemmatimonadaceae bacterium]|nr:TonB C-terminal domain-containing protein [Gemmatimonadaceae bacterium]
MGRRPDRGGARLAGPLGVSAVLHALLLAALFVLRPEAPPPMPPMYRVDLVAAPPGPRQIGVVRPPAPEPEPAKPAPVPPRAETSPQEMPAPTPARPAPRRPAAPATPSTQPPSRSTPANAPRAGGGPTGGSGTDVASVRTEGIEFPYPGYLQNIVRQIALRFDQPRCAVCRADVRFLIHRDGSVSEIRVVQRSGDFRFDLDAQGAVEAAGNARAFGPLPSGFPDDVLTIVFSFDPRVLR